MSKIVDPAVRSTVKSFADDLRKERGISESMMAMQVSIAVERLMEEHGIEVSEKRLASMWRPLNPHRPAPRTKSKGMRAGGMGGREGKGRGAMARPVTNYMGLKGKSENP